MIKAAIFDMDGLLIDSEPFWKTAEKQVYASMGITVTDEFLRNVEGTRLDEAIEFVHHHYPFSSKTFIEVEMEIIAIISRLIEERGSALPGVYDTLQIFKDNKIPIALASSSPMTLIETVIKKLGLENYFTHVLSAQHEPFGKPHPAIFLSTAADMKVSPLNCVVFEDSLNGIVAAKAARMTCIAVPDKLRFNDLRVGIADLKLSSLLEFNWAMIPALTIREND